jgi:ABC-type transport system involved in cytochrome c biogenesis permease subunit
MTTLFDAFETYLKLWIGLIILLYLLAGIFGVLRQRLPARVFFIAGFASNAAIVAINWLGCGQPPFGNMYHVLTFLPLCFFPLWLFLGWRDGLKWLLPHFALAAAVVLCGPLFMKDAGLAWLRMPALQSIWFVPHVVSYMISYALMAVAFTLVIESLTRRPTGQRLAAEDAAYQVTRLAMPFMTFGLLIGAVWADSAWGTYWGWDPKETWSLITWMCYLIYFHCRRVPDLRRAAPWAALFAFAALVITFLVVNLLPKFGGGLHSYS